MTKLDKSLKRELRVGKQAYVLTIEPEVFWRRGAPPKRPGARVPEGR